MSEKELAGIALEFWRASGPRSRVRLESLVAHFARVYAQPIEAEVRITKLAFDSLRSWERSHLDCAACA